MKRILNLVPVVLLLLAPAAYAHASDFLEESIGIIVVTHAVVEGHFVDEPEKPTVLKDVPFNCNGFLVRKDGKIYFVSVKHILTKYAGGKFSYYGKEFIVSKDDKANTAHILLPAIKNEFVEVPLSGENKFEVPETWYGLQNGTADVMAIDITANLKGLDSEGRFVPYEALVTISDQSLINHTDRVVVVGYPGGNFNKGIQRKEGNWNRKFGEIIPLGKQRLHGFSFGIELSGGDCGSPLVVLNEDRIYVIGLMRTGVSGPDKNDFPSIATDSIVLRDAISRRETN